MKITFKGDYALKAMLDLALRYNTEIVTAHDLAKRIDAPIKFLEQVLAELKKGGFIESKRGNSGGYLLSRAPELITVGQVVRFIEGPIEPILCVKEGYSNCSDIHKCVFKKMWQDVSRATSDIVDNLTFEKLVSQITDRQKALAYSI
ncbi:MAG: Rrf2 family transcriptional regulator [Candidatus Omnitrophota bacterium]